jgi:hypothetical protein
MKTNPNQKLLHINITVHEAQALLWLLPRANPLAHDFDALCEAIRTALDDAAIEDDATFTE